MQKITPFIWFDKNAEEAVNFYVSLLPDSKIVSVTRWGDTGPGPKGSALAIYFQLQGSDLVAMNGGPEFKPSPGLSLVIDCNSQEEVDRLWQKLGEGGQFMDCGWVTDRFGVTWQVTPRILPQMLQDKDQARADRVMKAMMKMKKIDIAALKKAYEA